MADASLRTAVDAIITINEFGTIESVNPAAATQFGYQRDELLGQNISLLAPEPHRSKHDGYLRHYLTTGEKKIIGIGRDVEGRHKDGHRFPIHLSVSEFHAGGKLYFTGIIHNLTARRRIENELVQQRALFQSIFNHIPDAMVLTNEDGVVSLCNPALSKIFGYQSDEIVGKSMSLLYNNEDEFAHHCAALSGDAQDVQTDPVRFTLRHKTGRLFPAELVCSPVHDSTGGRLGFLGLIRDVTEEEKREASLRQSQRMEVVGQLTGGIAHDFNNLLTVITGNHELLEMRLSDEKNRNLLRRSNDAAQMGVRLIGRLLAFSRRSQLAPAVVDLNDLVRGTLEVLRRTLGENIELISRLAPDLWQTRADPSEIENAVLNLAINARDAMSGNDRHDNQRDGRLTIETGNATIAGPRNNVGRQEDNASLRNNAGHDPKSGDYVVLSVSDNGHGMEPEVLARVFEPFFTTKQTGRGTGLGLSTIYGFAQQSGGHVAIDSAPGKGTRVELYLPRHDAEAVAALPASGAVAAANMMQGRILVVEDNREVRELTLERLQQLGLAVVVANNGVEALQILQQDNDIDLLFSDVVMPGGVSGIDLAKWVQSNRPGLKILLTSGFADKLARGRSEFGESVPVLRKPYDRAQLAQAISACLAGKPPA